MIAEKLKNFRERDHMAGAENEVPKYQSKLENILKAMNVKLKVTHGFGINFVQFF